jgi:hypothetical protein
MILYFMVAYLFFLALFSSSFENVWVVYGGAFVAALVASYVMKRRLGSVDERVSPDSFWAHVGDTAMWHAPDILIALLLAVAVYFFG